MHARTSRFEVATGVISVMLMVAGCSVPEAPNSAQEPTVASLIAEYLDAYFTTFPSRATAAGRHEYDDRLEDLSAIRREAWVETNADLVTVLETRLGEGGVGVEDTLDAELVLRHARREIDTFATRDRPGRDPLFWTGIVGNATVFLLVRDDLPLDQRLASATARAEQLPRLASQAIDAIEASSRGVLAPEHCRLAARQARASAGFYRDRFSLTAPDGPRRAAMAAAGNQAADAIDALAGAIEVAAEQASGSPRLGEAYAETFRIATGIERSVDVVLAEAMAALETKRTEAASFGRSVWSDLFDAPAPDDDVVLLRRLLARVAEDRATDVEAFIADYRTLINDAIDFVRTHDVVTLPEPLTLHTDRSPPYFVGQSVGGVYAAGPYSPEADTLFYLPSPPDEASKEQKTAFFRDFNHHFNVMITPHELVPGHYFQLKMAARHPRKVRALFGDGVYIEGWGTFCERLMLDLGWGGPLARLAHLKKQLENIARTIVDIRVHTQGMSRDAVLAFVRDEALQDEQFASNMWTRTLTSAPQLTSYFLGYQQVTALYNDVRDARGETFVLREFMDGMMEMGPVPVWNYRARMLESRAVSGD